MRHPPRRTLCSLAGRLARNLAACAQVVMLRHASRRPPYVWSQRCDQSSVPGPVSANSSLNPSHKPTCLLLKTPAVYTRSHGGARTMSTERVHGHGHVRQPAARQPRAAHIHSGQRSGGAAAALLRTQHVQPAGGFRRQAGRPADRRPQRPITWPRQQLVQLCRAADARAARFAHWPPALQCAGAAGQHRPRLPALGRRLHSCDRGSRLRSRRRAAYSGNCSPSPAGTPYDVAVLPAVHKSLLAVESTLGGD